MSLSQHDLGVAFALTAGAGLATGLGSAIVFVPDFYSTQLLAASLALAAGVMIYVSFIEIFFKGLDEMPHPDNLPESYLLIPTQELHFDEVEGINRTALTAEDYEPSAKAYHTTTAIFFAGIVVTWFLDRIIRSLFACQGSLTIHRTPRDGENMTAEDASGKIHTIDIDTLEEGKGADDEASRDSGCGPEPTNLTEMPTPAEETQKRIDAKRLLVTALITGAAVSLHNFPEGLATFIAAARDPSVGAPIALAIAVHNIPEGICVAVPIYFATKSKWKGFLWGTASGLAEPIAGGIGWIVLGTSNDEDRDISNLAYGLLFGLVAGMMVYISFQELLPTARNYDPQDKNVTRMLFLGMMIMAASLMLFQI